MFSSAETKVVTASASGVARLWRIHHGALEWELYGHDDAYMRCATLSPDRRFMATASALPQLELVFKGHDGWVNTAVFSPDCTQILTAAAARLWCTSTGKLIHTSIQPCDCEVVMLGLKLFVSVHGGESKKFVKQNNVKIVSIH